MLFYGNLALELCMSDGPNLKMALESVPVHQI